MSAKKPIVITPGVFIKPEIIDLTYPDYPLLQSSTSEANEFHQPDSDLNESFQSAAPSDPQRRDPYNLYPPDSGNGRSDPYNIYPRSDERPTTYQFVQNTIPTQDTINRGDSNHGNTNPTNSANSNSSNQGNQGNQGSQGNSYTSYSLATIPKYDKNGNVLTLGQRLALIRERSEAQTTVETIDLEANVVPVTSSASTPDTTTEDSTLSTYRRNKRVCMHGKRIQENAPVAVKVLVPLNLKTYVFQTAADDYKNKTGCEVIKCGNPYPSFQEFQMYIKGNADKVGECLCMIMEDIRQHYTLPNSRFHAGSRHVREESMLIVVPKAFKEVLLKFQANGKRIIKTLEEENRVWLKLEQFMVIEETLINMTGHKEQLASGLRDLTRLLSQTCFSDHLPRLLYYKPIAVHPNQTSQVFQRCDKREYEQWGHEQTYLREREMSREISPYAGSHPGDMSHYAGSHPGDMSPYAGRHFREMSPYPGSRDRSPSVGYTEGYQGNSCYRGNTGYHGNSGYCSSRYSPYNSYNR